MEEVTKEIEDKKIPKKKFTILGFTVWRLLVYFVVYSFAGFVIETLYGMITKGVFESRQSFLYGPFCSIYGLGAVVMIMFLQFFTKNNNRLFFGGFVIGSIVEYIVSFLGEVMLHVKWWDYSNMPFNLNGRICVFFSIFWGVLAIYLMSYVNPKLDKIINKMSSKISYQKLQFITVFSVVFLVLDCAATVYALGMFFIRKVAENDLNIENKAVIMEHYERIYTNPKKTAIIYKYFGDEKMIKTFPNLKIEDVDGNIIYFNCFVGDIKPYYYKFNKQIRGDIVNTLKREDDQIINVVEN